MKEIQPYTSISEAMTALDNGGRFYNIFTQADDGTISSAEIGKVGGLFSEKQKTTLFLELSISKLNAMDKAELLLSLDEDALENYQKYKAQELLPSQAASEGTVSSNAILTGIPKIAGSEKKLSGFILIPIMTGKAMTFVPVPIMEKYDVYELRDEVSSETFFIAHAKEAMKLPEEKIIVAGVIKELKSKKDGEGVKEKFLEVNYFLGDEG